ncbi:class I SAM-dependent methyltransferase [Chelatococcus sp. SYSU_G07232]|uniref:Class I SAM-dependent methyltransferase n=1 Tax=Chelatococcus albus TaxID=3047466 RepID=A0ABT7AMF2_9HYPH|nr:class I SAM-dependent methyltransferase [Chelatococcus sp. SYSU_G07232]MDJ1159984.1 class I SAM-dependent methyltransferase [Chelatococcus sp. SYSU_G07232]
MNVQVALKIPARATPPLSAGEEVRLAWLMQAIGRNRFLPAPPPESVFVGDGDYRAIGAEFLGHFVRLGELKPTERVLDIGCGIGRMAVPLTQYLEGEGAAYEGVDPVAEGIAWCTRTITPVYPNFRFCRVDVAHPLYNPQGQLAGEEVVLPFPDAGFDFAMMVSVATHLPLAEIGAYAREVARVLAPGGRLFLTAFLVAPGDPARETARPRFLPGEAPGTWIGDPQAPLAAIGFDIGLVEDALEAAGLVIRQVELGHWRGTDSAHYQDVIVAAKPGSAP